MSRDLRGDFLNAMRRLATTVSVLSTVDKRGWHGMTATAVTSVCSDPAAVLACVNSGSSFRKSLKEGARFCVNLLDSSQSELSSTFSGKLSGPERFSVGKWRTETGGLPYLIDAQANLFCTIDRIVLYGTHEIFIAKVDSARFSDKISPLIYQDGQYATTQLLPARGT